MIHLSLPYFYENAEFYEHTNDILRENRNNFQALNSNFNIEFMYGSFPFSFWNGNINSNYGEVLPTYKHYINFLNKNLLIPIVLDLSNIYLETTDFFDRHLNCILDLFKDNGTYLEISNINFVDIIKEKYPNYKFILSKNAGLIKDQNIEINNFELIQILPIDDNLLQSLVQKNKYQIIIGLKNDYLSLIQQENLNQISFSEKTNFDFIKNPKAIEMALEIKKYYEMGFSHFTIDSYLLQDLNNYNQNLYELLFTLDYLKEMEIDN